MTQIKKVKTSEGVQFYPQTHTKAVIDDNGYTAESRLGAMQDEINQAQLEVGAVPSDLAPTDGSTNWVTSGGVFNAIQVVQSNVTELEGEVPSNIEGTNVSDLDISDEIGNVLVRFEDGEIATKNFKSKETRIKTGETNTGDLSINDENGNIILLLKDGHILTKNFDSSIIPVNTITKYKGKKISILGDSISTFGTPSATNQNGAYCYSYYPTATCRYSENGVDSIQFNVNNTYWMKLINATGMTLGINESYRSSYVSGSGSTAFCSQTRINHLGENGTPDLILVFGGTNDAGNNVTIGSFNGGKYSDYDTAEEIASLPVATFADAYKAMLIRLMYTYPSSEIVCILPTFTTSYYQIDALDNYVEVIKEACDFFGVKWIDIRAAKINIFNKSSYLVDGIHPNVAGMNLIFEKIYKHLIFD